DDVNALVDLGEGQLLPPGGVGPITHVRVTDLHRRVDELGPRDVPGNVGVDQGNVHPPDHADDVRPVDLGIFSSLGHEAGNGPQEKAPLCLLVDVGGHVGLLQDRVHQGKLLVGEAVRYEIG